MQDPRENFFENFRFTSVVTCNKISITLDASCSRRALIYIHATPSQKGGPGESVLEHFSNLGHAQDHLAMLPCQLIINVI